MFLKKKSCWKSSINFPSEKNNGLILLSEKRIVKIEFNLFIKTNLTHFLIHQKRSNPFFFFSFLNSHIQLCFHNPNSLLYLLFKETRIDEDLMERKTNFKISKFR